VRTHIRRRSRRFQRSAFQTKFSPPCNLALVVLAALVIRATAALPAGFLTKPSESVLLLDEHTVARTVNLKQQFFPAKKHLANPILSKTEPWEGVGPYVWGNRLMQDAGSGEFRLYYTAYSFEGNFYRWGLATSKDGLHWTKPALNLGKLGATMARNWLPVGSHAEKGVLAIARDPRPETPPERRYLGIRFTYDGELISFSPDGITWKEYPSNPVWWVPSDIIHVMWDERRRHFVAYYKVWEVTGTEIRADGSEAKLVAHMPSFDQKKLTNGMIELTGPRIFFVTNGAAKVEKGRLALRANKQAADDGGGSSLSGDWNGKRVQAWAESEDGIRWSHEQIVMRADEHDPPTANIQYLFVMPYGGYYLGFLTMHDESGLFRIQLAWSSDGIHWARTWRQPWLDIGAKGTFDAGMVLGPADPVFLEREIAFPYGGFPITHDTTRQDWEAAIGLAVIRLDGFCAWQAEQSGELVTQPFQCTGEQLFVNADATEGSIHVEVLDDKGNPFNGFEAGSCTGIKGDSLQSQETGWVRWKDRASLKSLQGKRIQLRFVLMQARLYSFRVGGPQTLKLPTPRATTF
jgi:hypothetical protein